MAAVLLALTCGAAAPAAAWSVPPSVFWSNYNTGTISRASLDGSGGSVLNTSGTPSGNSDGVAVDPSANRIYWAIRSANRIAFANLDGTGSAGTLNTSGATVISPSGVAIDRVSGRIYWANSSGQKVSFAKLDGSGGGGDISTAGATVAFPQGVAIDRSANRIYWSNTGGSSNKISFANLDGSGSGGDLNTSGATTSTPNGVAVDPAGGKVYWANYNGNRISFAKADGSGGGDLNTTGATVGSSGGVAIDRAGNRIYWTNYSTSRISFANLDNTGAGGDLNTAGASPSGPYNSPAVYIGPLAPTASTAAASAVSVNGATLNGTVNPEGSATGYHFEYGTSTAYGSRAPASDASSGSDNTDHPASQTISGLAPNTTYHVRIAATNSAGTTYGADQVFTTSPLAPAATTLEAGDVGETDATLNGSVDSNGVATSYRFEYGTSTAYGSSTPDQSAAPGSSAQSASAPLSGLAPNTAYHFRLVATSSAGTTTGSDQTFTTRTPPAAPAAAPADPAELPATGVGRLVLSHRNTRATTAGTLIGARCEGLQGASCTVALKLQATRYRSRNDVGAARATRTITFNLAAGESKSLRVQLPDVTGVQLRNRHKAVVRAVAILAPPAVSVKKLMTVYDR